MHSVAVAIYIWGMSAAVLIMPTVLVIMWAITGGSKPMAQVRAAAAPAKDAPPARAITGDASTENA